MKEKRGIILFGAGQIGKNALRYFGPEKVSYFADNREALAGTSVDGVPVISFARLKEIHGEYQIVLSMDVGAALVVSAQLEDAGISGYDTFFRILNGGAEDTPVKPGSRTPAVVRGSRSEDGKQVLMIAYQFPPLSGSGVFRSIKFAKYLPAFGWQPTVISTDRPRPGWNYSDESMVEEIPETVTVIRIPDTLNASYGTKLPDRQHELISLLREIMGQDREALSLISEWERTNSGRAELMAFPCACLAWAYDVIRYIEETLDIGLFQAVYTTSDPYSAHLVGACLKRRYGLAWVADYRDPWTADPGQTFDYARPRDRLLLSLENTLLHLADKSIAVEAHLAADYVNRFHVPEEQIAVITNGYDEADYTRFPEGMKRPDKFTVNHSGILHMGRNLDAVLLALRQLRDEGELEIAHVRLRVVGEARQYDPRQIAENYGLGSIVEQTGYLSYQQALYSNLDSSLLFLLVGGSDKAKFAYTGKIFDYLRSGRPILAIAQSGGTVDRLLQETGHGQAFSSTQIPEIKAMILEEYRKWLSGEPQPPLHSPLIEQFERKRLTGQLAEILERAGAGGHRRGK